jgi:hypothetical protein
MAPESTVRGRENDSLVRPGNIHPQIPSFSGGYGIFRRFLCEKIIQWCRVGSTSHPPDYWSCPVPLDHRRLMKLYTKFKILSLPLTFPAWSNVKYQHGRGAYCPSPMLLFYNPPCRKTFPAWRNVIYQYGRGKKCSGTNRVFSHSHNAIFQRRVSF